MEKKCPFMKMITTYGNEQEEMFKTCIGDNCMAFKDGRCLLIQKSEFNFVN
ncbi:MAG: hypothetical protein ACRDD7_06380 [Peptostreptococcaceae bacterium]